MNSPDPAGPVASDAMRLREAAGQPLHRRLPVYFRLSGPGWLQSAITLGGGSLSGSLYLGVLGGFGTLWLQPLAMIIGIIMLCAIGHVVTATGRRPLPAINEFVNPVLGGGWAVASLLASMVWAMPQYSLSIGVLQQNLLPGLLGEAGPLGATGGKLVPALLILALSTWITWNYDRGGRGVKLYELILKLMVGIIVVCFTGVVWRIAATAPGLDWGALAAGFIPDFSLLTRPAAAFRDIIAATPAAHHAYWTGWLVGTQRDVIVAAAATAVGINMTFLFPYSILKRGWGREFNGLLRFDLATGMFIPFTLVTSFVVIAAASQFHAVPQPGILPDGGPAALSSPASPRQRSEYANLLKGLGPVADVTPADQRLAAMLVTRDAPHLAAALEPLTGAFFGRVIFSFGVLGMTLSTITLVMVISGMVVCELLGRPHSGWPFRLGSLLAASGVLGPFIWSKAAFWLAVPTSIFGFILMPIAYLAFSLLMNQRRLLGADMPAGGGRLLWNGLMGASLVATGSASAYLLWDKGGRWGLAAAAAFLLAAGAVDLKRRYSRSSARPET
jgi:Mn2+/Fe2+ NRAMP family transporter